RRDAREHGQDHPVGAGAGAAERLDQAEPLDRLLAALAGAGPDLDVEGPRELLEVHPADELAERLGADAGVEEAAVAGARPVALLEAAELELAQRLHRLERLDLLANLAELALGPLGLAAQLLAFGAERLVDARGEVGDLLLDRPLLVLLALLELG